MNYKFPYIRAFRNSLVKLSF